MTSLIHGHLLKSLQREVFLKIVGGEPFFDNDDLIVYLRETDEEVAVRGGGVNFVAEFLHRIFHFFQPLRRGEGDQCWLVCCGEKFKLLTHIISI